MHSIATLKQVTTAITMGNTNAGTIADALQKIAVAMTVGQTQNGTVASVLKQTVAAMVMTQVQQGTISVAEAKIVTALAMNIMQGGTMPLTLLKTSSAINSVMLPSGVIADTLPLPTAAMLAAQQQSGVIADVLPLTATGLFVGQIDQMAISTSLYQMSSALTGASTDLLAIASALPAVSTSLAGFQAQSGSIADVLHVPATSLVVGQYEQAAIASVLHQVATAISGAQGLGVAIADVLPAAISTAMNAFEQPGGFIAAALPSPASTALVGGQTQIGSIIDIIPQPTTAIHGAQTDAGTMASSLPSPPSSALVGNQNQGGTIADQLAKISAALAGVEQPQLAIAAALGLASTAITAGQAQAGVVADVLLKAVTSLQGLQTQSGTMASAVIQALTAMAINVVSASGPTLISSASAESTTLTMPTHAAGDFILMYCFRDGSTTLPTLPAGWTQINSGAANTCSARLAYKIAASSSETSGTWTSGTELVCQVYRNVQVIGASAVGTGSSATVNYPALSGMFTDGNSVVAAFSGHRSVNGNLALAPTGMVNRVSQAGATADAAGFDTNGGVSSWSSQNVATGETASGYISIVVELISAASVIPPAPTITGTNQVTANSISLPAHNIGDLIVVFATNSFSTPAAPPSAGGTVPAWALVTNASLGLGPAVYSFVATATNHTSGTWSNTTFMSAFVVTGQASGTYLGGRAATGSSFESTITVPSITLDNSDGSSLIVVLVAVAASMQVTFPAGYTVLNPSPSTASKPMFIAIKNSSTTDGSLAPTPSSGGADAGVQLEIKSR